MTTTIRGQAAHDELIGDAVASSPLPPLSVAYGGGGLFGVAYGLGVAHALLDAGVLLADAPAIGTSAGAWVASCVALGVEFGSLAALPALRVPSPRPGLLRRTALRVFGEATDARVRAVTCALPTLSRHVLDGAQIPLADLAAASSAFPTVFAPAMVGRRLLVDGGLRSLVSADLAAPAATLLVVAPLAGPMFGPAGGLMERRLTREMRSWERRTGGTACLLRPNRMLARLARHPLDLFDHDRACRVYPLAYLQASAVAEAWAGELPAAA